MPEGQQPQHEGFPQPSEVHASGEELMSFLDDELSPVQQRRLDEHLASCTACRDRLDRYRRATTEFSSEQLFPALPTSQPKIPNTPTLALQTVGTHAKGRLRFGWAASITVLLTASLLWQLVVAPPGVSARELIARARLEELRPLAQARTPAVHRTLRVTRKIGGMSEQTRHEEKWRGAPGLLSMAESPVATSDEVTQALASHGCATFAPLSVSMMDCLTALNLAQLRVEEVQSQEDSHTYRLSMDLLTPLEGTPLACTWILRSSDWRLTQVEFRIPAPLADIEYRVEELAYYVVDSLPITERTDGEKPPVAMSVPARRAPAIVPLSPPVPEPNARIKVAVLSALTSLGWHAEDEIRFHRNDSGTSQVDVLTSSEERKALFVKGLAGIDGINVSVHTYEEAAAELAPVTDDASTPVPSSSPNILQSEGPLMMEILAERFGGREQGRERAIDFGRSLVTITQDITYRTKWLENMSRMLPAEDTAKLHEEQQLELESVKRQMLAEIADLHEQLRRQVRTVLCPEYCTAGESHVPGNYETHGEEEGLAPAMDREFALLKVLFVDRDFEPQGTTADVSMAAQRLGSQWTVTSANVHQEIRRLSTEGQSRVAGVTPNPRH